MKSYDKLKDGMEASQQRMVEAKNSERANALKEAKFFCKEFWLYCWDAQRLSR